MTIRLTSSRAAAVAGSFALIAGGGCPLVVAAQDPESDQAVLDEPVPDEVDDVIEVVEEADQVRVTGSRVATDGLLVGQGDRIELTYWVSYTDLDLAGEEGARELEGRVGAAAEHICERLSEMYPAGAPGPEACAREAIDAAMAELDEPGGRSAR